METPQEFYQRCIESGWFNPMFIEWQLDYERFDWD